MGKVNKYKLPVSLYAVVILDGNGQNPCPGQMYGEAVGPWQGWTGVITPNEKMAEEECEKRRRCGQKNAHVVKWNIDSYSLHPDLKEILY